MSRATWDEEDQPGWRGPSGWWFGAPLLVTALVLLVLWWTGSTGSVDTANKTLDKARRALDAQLAQVIRYPVEPDHFACCGASAPSGDFFGVLTPSASQLVGAERLAAALRSSGWSTWQEIGVDVPLKADEGGDVTFEAAPRSTLDEEQTGRGVEVFVHRYTAADVGGTEWHAGDVVVSVSIRTDGIYHP